MAVRERWSKTSPIGWSTPQCIDLVRAPVAAERRIEACYLFGSRATGNATPDSDLDLAIYADCRFAGEDLLELGADLTRRLQSDRVHLVWLNRADPVVAFSVLRNGKLLH